jgi:hypothetical protein
MGIEAIPVVDSASLEEEEQPLSDIRFQVSVRGWKHNAHQFRARTLLTMEDKKMAKQLRVDKDIILLPKDWWSDKAGQLEPEDRGWWYTVTEPVKFRECKVCTNRRGDDLDEETRTMHGIKCKGCAVILPGSVKKGRKRVSEKGKHSTTERIQTQIGNQ